MQYINHAIIIAVAHVVIIRFVALTGMSGNRIKVIMDAYIKAVVAFRAISRRLRSAFP